jgi:hypothetical protein
LSRSASTLVDGLAVAIVSFNTCGTDIFLYKRLKSSEDLYSPLFIEEILFRD